MECNHENSEVKKMESGVHWGKLICSDCGRFIKWLADPEKKSYKERCEALIEICSSIIDDNFVGSVTLWYEERGFITPKQYEALKEKAINNNLEHRLKALGVL